MQELRETGGRNCGSVRGGTVLAVGLERVAGASAKPWRRRWRGMWTPMSICDAAARICAHGRAQNLDMSDRGASVAATAADVDLLKPADTAADIVATLLYPVTDRPYRELYEMACSWSAARRNEVIDVALQSRTRRDELLRNFRSAPYVFDIVMDIGAYRDLHRHRRCQQFRQSLLGQARLRNSGC